MLGQPDKEKGRVYLLIFILIILKLESRGKYIDTPRIHSSLCMAPVELNKTFPEIIEGSAIIVYEPYCDFKALFCT